MQITDSKQGFPHGFSIQIRAVNRCCNAKL
jgi:hypothetical protein